MFKIFTDTDTDITLEVAEKYGYHLISMPYVVNGELIHPYKDFKIFDPHKYYESLRKGVLPSTCGLSPEEYIAYFEPVFKEGYDILYVHFSRAMTATFDYMDMALKQLKEKYPDRKFYEIDTKGITIGSLNIVLEVGDMYLAKKSIEEIMAWAEKEVDKFAMYFYAEDLKFFARSGRVKGIKALMGNIFGIRPIITMGSDGVMTNVGTAHGHLKTIKTLLAKVEELGEDIDKHRILIGHTDALKSATELKDLLIKKYGDKLNVVFVDVNPTAGAHCGPDGVGISFHAIHR